jgi:hypothetical protein
MNLSFSVWKLLAAVCVLAVCSPAQEKGMEMSGFRVPEYDDQGNMTAQLFGKHAEVAVSGEVKIDQLRLEFYQDGATFVTVESPFCFYDSQKREAYSDAVVSAVADKIQVTGRGFEWKPALHSVRIFNEAHVVLEDAGRLSSSVFSGSESSSTGGVVTITSKELFLDYTAKMVQFEKEVCVKNSSGTEMHCEKLKIPLGEGQDAGFLTLPGMPTVE